MCRDFALALLVVALSATVSAQGIASETVTARVGAYFTRVSTDISASANGIAGTDIDLENDLGLSSSDTNPVFQLDWRFAQRHRLELQYFALSRSATRNIDREINIDGDTYPINTTVSATFKSQVTALTYFYSVWQTPQHEVALGLGVHNTTFKPSLSASGAGLSTSLSADVPLPVLALRGDMQFNERWIGSSSVKWFGLNYGDYDGGLTTFNLSVAYLFTKNWGVELAYGFNRYSLDVSKSDWNGELKYRFSGPAISLLARF